MRYFFLLTLFSLFAFGQVRTDTFNAANVKVNTLQLSTLPDGGCAAIWCGTLTSNEGTVKLSECSPAWELDTVALRNTCTSQVNFGKVKLAPEFGFDGGT